MKKLIKHTLQITGIIVGGLAGYWYWKEIGGLSGTCPIKSHWQTSVPYDTLVGYILFDFFKQLAYHYADK
jgi:hypothetical protein